MTSRRTRRQKIYASVSRVQIRVRNPKGPDGAHGAECGTVVSAATDLEKSGIV